VQNTPGESQSKRQRDRIANMSLDQTAIIKQIDDVLGNSANVAGAAEVSRAFNVLLSAIHRLAPPGSIYVKNLKGYEASQAGGIVEMSRKLEPIRGMLEALRSDYESGYHQSVVELVHADMFADFLDMADYLLQQGYKDPAAVVAGSVLEAHLRKLCDKHGIPVVKPDGSPKNANTLNSELSGADIYSKLDQKNVTAWQDLRNKAAHGKYSEYTQEQVALMIQGVRDFASRYPA
jgi:hypothetical protein